MIRRAAYVALLGMALTASPPPSAATTPPVCRIALLLALDVSSSVDAQEDMLQRRGLAAALTAPEVQAAFLNAPHSVAFSVYEWSGRTQHHTLLDWTVIDSRQTLLESAAQLALSKRSTTEFPTALGHAVGHAARLFREAPPCDVQVLDVSGDGENNDGFTPKQAYNAFPLDGVTVNALAIETFGEKAADLGAQPGDMVTYYKRELIRGPAAFVEVADGFDDFENAMRRKLSRELSVTVLGQLDLHP
ncbi:DUF1194 domain-containing protein [Shimia sagamensis]|uniref:VWFA domain-containing protein n=1 Tax=Shimia sagamensis TaxID=1566352 RepID=A0ABY1NMX6_9RHOB|nr:DUF1194 domain-containing protein [Shimia sagamensis]SMP12917.1 Protein of unknown function [Shimia sagamensis]